MAEEGLPHLELVEQLEEFLAGQEGKFGDFEVAEVRADHELGSSRVDLDLGEVEKSFEPTPAFPRRSEGFPTAAHLFLFERELSERLEGELVFLLLGDFREHRVNSPGAEGVINVALEMTVKVGVEAKIGVRERGEGKVAHYSLRALVPADDLGANERACAAEGQGEDALDVGGAANEGSVDVHGVDRLACKGESRGPVSSAVDVLNSEAHDEITGGTRESKERGVESSRTRDSESRRVSSLGSVSA